MCCLMSIGRRVSYGKCRDCHFNQRPKATLPVKSQSENYTWNNIREARKGLDLKKNRLHLNLTQKINQS